MITRKDLIVAVLCTFCLTMVLVSTMPVKSAGVYDPWVDTNHDGHINVLDLIKVAGVLGTSGNPGLNVTVMNWPNSTDHLVWWYATVNNVAISSGPYLAEGFAHLNVIASCSPGSDTITVEVLGTLWNSAHNAYIATLAYQVILSISQSTIAFSIPVPSQDFSFYAFGSSATIHNLSLSYYLTWG